ncbi:hypothetical protein [Burkholderia sp. MSMB1826]|uniref:hypothetical protein n=1 Tax=Burkholderia sp. MSMB1826 TaxID=1637875 RepID=UPI0012E3621F|nr:hypothetical protein [Burkholderia sp. MSMB1826]
MRVQSRSSSLTTAFADRQTAGRGISATGGPSLKSRFSGSASALLSSLRSMGARLARRLLATAPMAASSKEAPVVDAVQWINQQRRQGNAPRIGANRDVTKLTREQAMVLNTAVPKRVPPAPPTSKSSAIVKAKKATTESFHASPETDSDDDLFELRLPATDHAAPRTQFQLFNEECAFLGVPVQKSPHFHASASRRGEQ